MSAGAFSAMCDLCHREILEHELESDRYSVLVFDVLDGDDLEVLVRCQGCVMKTTCVDGGDC